MSAKNHLLFKINNSVHGFDKLQLESLAFTLQNQQWDA